MILSGRSDVTHQATRDWSNKHGVWFDTLTMRTKHYHYTKDSDLKQMWLDGIGVDNVAMVFDDRNHCLLYTSPSPRDRQKSRMPSSA